ncbi:CHAT domain-containing protein [bacterium]|nr:CHAT domain-containing protein [bacterium]
MKLLPSVLLLSLLLSLFGCGGTGTVQEDGRIREGRAMYDRSEFDRAQKHFQSILAAAKRDDDLLLQSQCEKWLGNILLAYEKPDEALNWYQHSLQLLERGIAQADSSGAEPPRIWLDERQNVRSNIAVVYKNGGRYEDAIEGFNAVLAYDRESRDDFRIAVSLYNLADVYNHYAVDSRLKGDRVRFTELLQQARQLLHASLAQHPTADAWLNLGNNYAFANQLDSAVTSYRAAEELYRDAGYRVHRALALGNIGLLSLRLGQRDAAAEALRTSIAIIEQLRGSISSIDIRSSFISDKYFIYENLIALLVDMHEVDEAFMYVERAKARSFLDMIGNKAVGEGKERPPDVQALVDREQALQHRIAALLSAPDSTEQLGAAIESHQEVISALREKDPEYASVKSIDPLSIDSLQSMLDDSTALVEYFLGEKRSFVFVIRRDTVAVEEVNVSSGQALERDIEKLRRALYYDYPMQKTAVIREQRLGEGATPQEAMQRWYATSTDNSWQFQLTGMYSRLFAPMEKYLEDATQLYIIPHGPLHHLPFQALVPVRGIDMRDSIHVARPHYLIEDYAIAYLPSASVLGFALEKEMDTAHSALIVGDPLYADPKYRRRPLPGALIEADTVAHYAPHPLLLKREEAEESVVKKEIGQKDILHFATHGELNKKNPMQSRILLAAAHPDSVNNGDLTVAKIFNLDLHSLLVTLSACQTAQLAGEEGGFSPGDDLVGLTRSFMYAGTPAVIASLWYVDDEATLSWMRLFYRSWLQRHHGRMQSARRAALSMLNNPADPDWVFPYYWAAFIYIGDNR